MFLNIFAGKFSKTSQIKYFQTPRIKCPDVCQKAKMHVFVYFVVKFHFWDFLRHFSGKNQSYLYLINLVSFLMQFVLGHMLF